MPEKDSLKWVIDWWLPKEQFCRLVDELIERATASGKVLALPMQIHAGQVYRDYLTLLLAQVHCGACDAPCCRENPDSEPTTILPSEYRRLAKKYGEENLVMGKKLAFIPMPCPFLKNNRCTIYEDRPLTCVFYPFQHGAFDDNGKSMMALASACPEARRITRQVYMAAWWIGHQSRLIDKSEIRIKEEKK